MPSAALAAVPVAGQHRLDADEPEPERAGRDEERRRAGHAVGAGSRVARGGLPVSSDGRPAQASGVPSRP